MVERKRSVDILVNRVETNPLFIEKLQNDPVAALQEMAEDIKHSYPTTASQDKFAFRIAVTVLSLVVLIVVSAITAVFLLSVIKAAAQPQFPEILVAIGSTALGALAGLLAPANQRMAE
jgi:hypothetical protein